MHRHHVPRRCSPTAFATAAFLLTLLPLLTSCGSTSSSTTSTTTTTPASTNPYTAAYQALTWASGVTVTFPSTCQMNVSASGVPPTHDTYYLTPATGSEPVVATTASGIQLAVAAYATSGISTVSKTSGTFNICPAKASTTTTTGLGAIGVMTSGEAMFNAYEATSTVALSDNVSYTFTTGGQTYTASFIDECNSHAAPGMGNSGATWHYHGNPVCWTATVDGATGASHIIGIALDGFPIYGGRDINGKVIDPTTLDACNGITSATPEFPSGAYHYVLPIDATGAVVKTKQSSLNCYTGTPNAQLMAMMKKLGCNMPFLLANGQARLPDGREVSRSRATAWLRTMQQQMNPTIPNRMLAANAPSPAQRT